MRRVAACLALGALLAGGCGKVVGDLPDGQPGGTVDGRPSTAFDAPLGGLIDARPGVDATPVTTIRALRMSPPPDGTPVSLRGVIVVAKDSSGQNGIVVLQDPDFGDYSGIVMLCNFSDQAQCTLTRAQIDGMLLGQPLNIDAVYGMPAGAGPRLVRAQVANAGPVVTLNPRTIDPAVLGPTQAGNPATQALLWTYVRVNGPVQVINVTVPEFELSCAMSTDDAGVPDSFHRAVLTQVNGANDLAVGMRRGDPMAAFCLFECGQTCNAELMVGDTFNFVQGIVDVFVAPGGAPHVILSPVRNTDVGPKN